MPPMQNISPRVRRHTASPLLAALAVAAGHALTPSAGAQNARTNSMNVLAVGTARTEVLTSAQIVQLQGAPVTTQVTFSTNMPSPDLGSILAYALVGKPVQSRLTIAAVDINSNRVLSGAVVQTNVQEIDLPVANAATKTGTSFVVKLFPSVSRDVPATLATTAMFRPARALMSDAFRLAIDSVNGNGVVSVSPIVVTFPGNDKYPGRAQITPIVVRVVQLRMGDFQKWLSSGAMRNGTLEFLGPDMKSTLLTVQLRGMKITSITTATASGSVQMSDVSISITALTVADWKPDAPAR